MPRRIYIETTIPSYLTARPSRDIVQAARQQLTRERWDVERRNYDLCISQIVLLVAISVGFLLLCGCAGRNPIEPPIPPADAGYSGGQRTLATIAAFAGVFGPAITMKANDDAAQMYVRVNWDCHRWGQFVEKVVLANMEGRSQDAVLKDVHALNATYQCFNCPQGMFRVKIVHNLYTLYSSNKHMLPTTAELPEIGKAFEAQCDKDIRLN